MANKYRQNTENDSAADEEVPAISPEPAPVKAAVAPKVMLSFDRWFAATGKPLHHKRGMAAFIGGKTGGKRTQESWDSLFNNY